METEETQILKAILTEEEFEKVPNEIQKKIDSIYGERFAEFLVQKGLCDTARNSIDQIRTESEEKISELTLKYQDESAKLTLSEQSVTELRDLLQSSKDELHRTQDTLSRYEQETAEYRKERNNVLDERDSLLKICERRNIEVERLQSDVQKLEQQLSAAINAKCEALAKVDEIASKEVSIDFKEKRFEQERQMLQNQIQSLTNDLNRNIGELQNARREYSLKSMTIETKLNQKTEELNIANGQIAHLQEQNAGLVTKTEELSSKLLEQNEDMRKMMEHYKKELHSQSKLADLYKETSDDKTKQTAELASAVTELQKLLHEATDEYGQLETQLKGVDAKHDRELEAKNQEIQALKDELKNANDLLRLSQEENLEHAVEKLAPTAAATSRMLKTGMSLTELYSKFVQATEEVQLEKKENARLNLQMNTILQEIEEKAPIMKKQQLEYKNAMQANAELTAQLESMIQERVNMRQEVNDTSGKVGYYEREMSKLKAERADLGRQVCYLLRQIEEMRGGFAMERDQSISSEMSANEVITKKLVTFSDIQELQENNMKLLLLVRDLSGKLEEMEEVQNNMSQATYEAKLANYTKRLQEMQETQEYQTQMMNNCLQQRDRYKKMYTDMLKNKSGPGSLNGSLMDTGDDDDLASSVSSHPDAHATGAASSSAAAATENKRKLTNLEEKLQETQKKLQELKEEYDNYRKEKMTNDKMVNEQFDGMRKEMLDLTSANCKLTSTVQYNGEQLKLQQKNVATYKKQISILEERNKNYEATIIKHETNLMYLKDETLASQAKLGRAEAMVESLKQETRMLRDKETRLQAEREVFQRERQNQNLLLNNLEMIKATFERSETDGKMRLEQRLDEANRECSALRRRLQEEQDRFRELTVHLERQSDTARQRMEEEVVIAEKLREELKILRAEMAAKSEKVDELGKKLQESLAPSRSDNPITQATKRIKELELRLGESAIELKALQKEIDQTKEHAKQYCNMATSAEKELNELNEAFAAYRAEMELDLAQTKKNEATLKAKVEEMETEIALQITGAQLSTGDQNSTLHKAQRELQDALTKISENNRDLRDLRNQCTSLQQSLQETEQKYANEMVLHSQDIQAAQNLKDELQKTKKQFDELQSTRDRAVDELEANKSGWQVNLTTLQSQKDELEQRVVDLNDQNAALHDQIQSLSTKLSITVAAAAQDREMPTASDAMNESTTANDSLLAAIAANKSIHEDDVKSSEQLLQIIKYLRKEKDIAVAKFDILRSENVRLHSELEMLNKKLQELQDELVSERAKSEAGGLNANKHDEIMRKVETLNAVTDSNRILREERDTLTRKVRDLNERLTKVEDELFPLQEKNCELTAKVESVGAENASLRIEATKWRQRANLLVERSNKTSPEDWKKLQTERDTLTKALASEKEAMRKANEELVQIRADKARLDVEVQTWSRQATTSGEENKKYVEELNVLRQAGVRMTQEINEVKSMLAKREEELKQLTESLSQRDAQLLDARNKEVQIRKIAKRYKDSYFELKNKVDEKNANGGEPEGEDSAAGGEPVVAPSNVERVTALEAEIIDLKTQITSAQQEMEAMRRDNEGLKANQEKEDRNKLLLKEAKNRIMTLTESKNAIVRELTTAKTQLQALEQSRDEHELLVNGLKSQYDTKLQRLTDQDQENKEALTRLQRENETLAMRINQLHRQMGIQQGAKPTTSGVGAGGEKIAAETAPRTANVKPMAGTSSTGQQSATVTPRRGGETPLASIRPMSVQQSSRTAAVLPTSQTPQGSSTSSSSTSGGSGSSSTTSSVTALVPPQQQVHTTGNNNSSNSGASAEAMSSSPTSSHTDYQLCTTSSAIAVVAAIPQQQQQEPGTAESSSQQEAETAPNNDTTSSTTNNASAAQQPSGGQQLQQQQQQAVALVSPRVESAPQMVAPQQLSPQNVEQNQASTSTSNIPVAMSSSHHQASSSNTVTTTQAGGHKRPRDVEGDSSTSQSEEQSEKAQPQKKRTRVQDGVSESGLDVEYQVPTSSQRDQEDDGIIVVDSDDDDEEEDEMDADEGDVNEADGMDDAGENYEMDGSYQDHDMAQYDEGGPDIDENDDEDEEVEDNNTNNEVDVDDDSEVPNQSGATPGGVQQVAPIATTTSSTSSTSAADGGDNVAAGESSATDQQIQSISSGSDAAGSSSSTPSSQTWRQVAPHSRQQQAHLMIMQQQGYEDVEDRIVPSTPTLFAPRSAASPHPAQVPHAARFTFNESTASTTAPQRNAVVPEGMDDTRVDLSDEANDSTISTGRSVPSTPQLVSAPQDLTTAASTTGTAGEEAEAATSQQSDQPEGEPTDEGEEAPSHSEVPEISVTAASEEDDYISESNDEQAGPSQEHKDPAAEAQEPEEDGADGVSSEGEKTATDSMLVVEEGSEAEVLEAPSSNTRSRATTPNRSHRGQRGRGYQGPPRPTPIVWQDSPRPHGNQFLQQQQQHSRGNRARRARRPSGQSFGGSMRY